MKIKTKIKLKLKLKLKLKIKIKNKNKNKIKMKNTMSECFSLFSLFIILKIFSFKLNKINDHCLEILWNFD